MSMFQQRNDVPTEYTWNLESMFPSNEEWETHFQSLQRRLPELEALRQTLAQSAPALLAVLDKRDELFEELDRLCIYALMRHHEDARISLYQGMNVRAQQLRTALSKAASYIEPEILMLSQTTLEQFLQEEPALVSYEHSLRNLMRQQTHIRSSEVEEVLAAVRELAGTPTIHFSMLGSDQKFLSITDEEGEQVVLTTSKSFAFMRSREQRVRKEAFEGLFGSLLAQRHARAATLAAQIKATLFFTRQRRYRSCRAYTLAQENIPEQVYDTLVETTNAHLPLLHRYLKVRRHVLHLEELHMYDLNNPLFEEAQPAMSYRQACETIVAALAPLGEAYQQDLTQGLGQRWVDVYETPGKRFGAYTAGAFGTFPFILLNFQHDRDTMYLLAHELGHAMHSFYTQRSQPYHKSDYTIFVAEIASTVNERFLTEYLLNKAPDAVARLAILDKSLSTFRGLLFQRVLLAEFEQQIYHHAEEGEAVLAETLNAIYHALHEKYYGAEVIVDALNAIEWARIPQFYTYPFYHYQYATGISAATALVQQMLSEGTPAVDRYLAFLYAGCSDYSLELLKQAGVDMTSSQPVHQALQVFELHVTEMEKLLQEMHL